MNAGREDPPDAIQVLSWTGGVITQTSWALPDDCAGEWRAKLTAIYGSPDAETIFTPEGIRSILAAGELAMENNEVVMMIQHDL